jgi:hypothetical protein
MTGELSKSLKRKLRELGYQAHEQALRQPLADLGAQFDRWRRGEIDAIQLADSIREFNDGPSREIYQRFTWSRNDDLPMLVAYGVDRGLLDENTLPDEVKAAIARWLAFLRAER